MTDQRAALETALERIQRQFGPASIFRMSDGPDLSVDCWPSGLLTLEQALGIPGLPKGRIVEIYGPESSGKTTLALFFLAAVQRAGGTAAIIDAEHALDAVWSETIGVDIDALLLSQPQTGEQGLEILDKLTCSGAVDLVIVDSVAALAPKAEIEGDMGDKHMGLQARLMSQALRKLVPALKRSGTTVVFINQIRTKIGQIYGSPETTTGGKALKFYSSIRIDTRQGRVTRNEDQPIGHELKLKIEKNKLARPFRKAILSLRYDRGICPVLDLISFAERSGAISKSGSWYRFQDQSLAQGHEALAERLRADTTLAARIRGASLGSDATRETRLIQREEVSRETSIGETGQLAFF